MHSSSGSTAFSSLHSIDSSRHILSHSSFTTFKTAPSSNGASLTTTLLHATPNNIPNDLPLVPLATIAALILLITAQSFINFLLKGDRGLGAFLSDGSGYNKSGFRRTNNSDDRMETDPLPWLKLPMFDYVDVAGQKKEQKKVAVSTEEEIALLRRMEEMKDQIREMIDEGEYDSARKIELELELLMKAEGYEFKKSFE
jgi:hypothetical protein